MFSFFIQHILGHLPYWIWPFLAGVGAGVYLLLDATSTVTSIVPQVKGYALAIKAVCIAVILSSVFLFGAEGTLNIYKQQEQKDKQVVAVAKQASKDTNTQVANNLTAADNEVKIRTVYVNTYIHDNAAQINADCKTIDTNAWTAYNRAVTNATGAKQ